MIKFIFTKQSKQIFETFQKDIQNRIKIKLNNLKTHPDIFSITRKLVNFKKATHRLRIGNYRLILELKADSDPNINFIVLDIGHRKDIYL